MLVCVSDNWSIPSGSIIHPVVWMMSFNKQGPDLEAFKKFSWESHVEESVWQWCGGEGVTGVMASPLCPCFCQVIDSTHCQVIDSYWNKVTHM